MTYQLMTDILDELNIKYTYLQFDPGELDGVDKYIAYFESDKIRYLADDKVYHYEPHFAVELYTKYKDINTEQDLIGLFDKNEVPWSGGVSTYIDSEKMYMTVFYV